MTCRQVVQLLTDYLDDALPAADRARVEEHLAGCDGCTAFLAQLRTTRRVVAGLAAVEVPPAGRADLLRAFRDWKV
jgi:anti-sigma factor RsiW